MVTRGGRGQQRRTAVRPVLLLGLATAVLVACVLLLPPLLVPLRVRAADGIGTLDRMRLEHERIGLQNQARATLLQAFGGAFFLVTAFLTWRQIQVNREGQITERFTRAIEHLGAEDKLDVRLGGIYALERIANDSRSDRGAIIEILTAYVRGHAASAGPGDDPAGPPLRVRAADLQAAMTVLGRRAASADDPPVMQLGGIDLRGASLGGADLRMADLSATDLSGSSLRAADLRAANLERARLARADLREANLGGTRLEQADLREAELVGADLTDADLQRAGLRAADLRRSLLRRADLRGVNLGEARLEGARLEGATLRDANLWEAKLAGADLRGVDLTASSLVQADLDGVDLSGATLNGASLVGATLHGTAFAGVTANRKTVWPSGFDWRSAGVAVEG